MTSNSDQGLILEIQRMSTEDGPGIRTTVFFKGCPLSCLWCHNPESISPRPQVHWIGSRCIGCRSCLEVCSNQALVHEAEGVRIDRNLCQGCGSCAEECPSTALELMGRTWRAADLAAEVAKDRVYFEKSGGGVTASGGEATRQAGFAAEFLSQCRKLGLHTALDTCGFCSPQALETVLPQADLVLFDLKVADPVQHEKLTGVSPELIHRNLALVDDWIKKGRGPSALWIRTPIIPGATGSPENIAGLGKLISENTSGTPSRWELCAFNNLCRDKYIRLGLDWRYKDAPLVTDAEMENLAEAARRSGPDPGLIHWSGSTRQNGSQAALEKPEPRLRLVKGTRPGEENKNAQD